VSPCGAGSYNSGEALGKSGPSQHVGKTIGSGYVQRVTTTDLKTKQHTKRICESKNEEGARNKILTGTMHVMYCHTLLHKHLNTNLKNNNLEMVEQFIDNNRKNGLSLFYWHIFDILRAFYNLQLIHSTLYIGTFVDITGIYISKKIIIQFCFPTK
jgi:hypothetical protein